MGIPEAGTAVQAIFSTIFLRPLRPIQIDGRVRTDARSGAIPSLRGLAMLRFHQVSHVCRPPRSISGLAAIALALLPTAVQAAVAWHTDLATAKAAAAANARPVLAVFTAGWTGGGDPAGPSVLVSPESEALISACFEPVRIDVDAQPALTKDLGISHVPSVCIMAPDDTVLSKFELPGTTPEFVAAAAKAAQAAASHRTAVAEQTDLRIRVSPATEPTSGSAFATRGPVSPSVAAQSAPGSISLVTAKVRELSDFANDAPPAAGSGFQPVSPSAVAAAQPQPPAPAVGNPAVLPQPAPTLARAPAGWPTETPASSLAQPPAFAATPPAQPGRPAVEPAASTLAQAAPTAPASPWLGAAPPAAAATVPTPAAPLAPEAASPSEPPKSLSAQFLAAMQKPFTFWQKSSEIPKPSAEALAIPPTLPPARPLPPGATPATVAAASTPAAETPDTHGSMPLGLEGYCPVTLAEKGQWTEGRAQWGARHRGRTYLFASEEQQRAFLADPDRYAPALSGDDPVLACDKRTSAPGQRRYGVTYQSRMYLFSSPETRSQFAANPNRYVGRVALAETPTRSGGTILR
jgi:YHS domain-containing protein